MYAGGIILFTGEDDQAQNTVAMMHVGIALEIGQPIYHNGCSNHGWLIQPETLSSAARFAALLSLDAVLEGSLIILADADYIPAITDIEGQFRPKWLQIAMDKGLQIVLTTVRGREYMLNEFLFLDDTIHVLVEVRFEGDGVIVTFYSGGMRERIPRNRERINKEAIVDFAKLSNGQYASPERDQNELISNPPMSQVTNADYVEAVRSVDTSKPKHHAYVFLMTRLLVMYPDIQVRTSEMINRIWIETVDKYNIERVALTRLSYACAQWGIALSEVQHNSDVDSYPDGLAMGRSGKVNIEVTKVQPKWPSGATFSQLASLSVSGREAHPGASPILQCTQCGQAEVPDFSDVHNLPDHDEKHVWTCTFPKSILGPDWDDHIVALPVIRLTKQLLEEEIRKATNRKSKKVDRFGGGSQNWLVLLIEGFPVEPDWYEDIGNLDWDTFDGVFAILTDEYTGGIQGGQPNVPEDVIVVKCPESGNHFCYHPGVVLLSHRGGPAFYEMRDLKKLQGLMVELIDADGTVFAERELEIRQPFTQADLKERIGRAIKKLAGPVGE